MKQTKINFFAKPNQTIKKIANRKKTKLFVDIDEKEDEENDEQRRGREKKKQKNGGKSDERQVTGKERKEVAQPMDKHKEEAREEVASEEGARREELFNIETVLLQREIGDRRTAKRRQIQTNFVLDYVPIGVLDDPLFLGGSSYCLNSKFNHISSGGEFGHISLYSTNALLEKYAIKPKDEEGGLEMSEVLVDQQPILASRNCNDRWTSDLAFVSPFVLCSSSDDGFLRLWSTINGENLDSCLIDQTNGVGVYSCDSNSGNIVSGLKDGSMRLHRAEEFRAVQNFATGHGVVKCVRFKENSCDIVASCGNDKVCRISDIREKSIGSLSTLPMQKSVNHVQWNCSDPERLLTCGFDNLISLYDCRQFGKPYLSFPCATADQRKVMKPIWAGAECCKIVIPSFNGRTIDCFNALDGEYLCAVDSPFGKVISLVCKIETRDDLIYAVSNDGSLFCLQSQMWID